MIQNSPTLTRRKWLGAVSTPAMGAVTSAIGLIRGRARTQELGCARVQHPQFWGEG